MLLAQGPATARELMAKLAISQPTLSRRLKALGAQVEAIGNARNRSYALRRAVRQMGHTWPVFQLDASGQPNRWGELLALHGGFRLRLAPPASWLDQAYPEGMHSGLPFVLQDLAPQGFLGRAIAREIAPLLHVVEDPREWNDDDRLAFMLHRGHDLPGNLVIGERMLAQALRAGLDAVRNAVPPGECQEKYPLFAEAALRGEIVGSSAGGEQPKFPAIIREGDGLLRHVLVKFSAADPSPIRQRWLDLLVCEHLAAQVIDRHGLPAVQARLLYGGSRRFLEVTRFDRTPVGGRQGIISLGTLVDGLVDASCADWVEAAVALERARMIAPDTSRQLRWLWCFGDLIGNTDMHFGNVSFRLTANPPFELCPAYDMLPMAFAPDRQGELRAPSFTPRPPLPSVVDVWPQAAEAAQAFWTQVETEALVSEEFRGLANACRQAVSRWQARR